MTLDLQDSGKLFVTPRMALLTLTMFYNGLNQVLTPFSIFSGKSEEEKILYLNQAIWGGVLTSSIGFTKM